MRRLRITLDGVELVMSAVLTPATLAFTAALITQ